MLPKGFDGILKWFTFFAISLSLSVALAVPSFAFIKVSCHPFAHIFTIFLPNKNLIILKNQFEHANAYPAASHTTTIVEPNIVHEIAMRLKSFHINNSVEWL